MAIMEPKVALMYRFVYPCRVVRVIDGDTVEVDLDVGLDITIRKIIRFYGINTPERAAGQEATDFVQAWVAMNPTLWIETHKDRTGKYGRYLGTLYNEAGVSLSDLLVQKNFAEII